MNGTWLTHKCLFANVVPCYISEDLHCPLIIERHFIFKPAFTVALYIIDTYNMIAGLLNTYYQPTYPILLDNTPLDEPIWYEYKDRTIDQG